MFNRSARRARRKTNETRVTLRKRNLLLAGGASLAGLTLGICVLNEAVAPDQATAVASVISATTAVVALLLRRSPTQAVEGTGSVAVDK